MEYRQRLVDAAVEQLRYLTGEQVDQHGTFVQVESGFKMARVIEAVMRVAFDDNEPLIRELAISITPPGEDWADYRDQAVDGLVAVRGSILSQLDPLP